MNDQSASSIKLSSGAVTAVREPFWARAAPRLFIVVSWVLRSKWQPSCEPPNFHQGAIGSLSGSTSRKVTPQVSWKCLTTVAR
jgi:hypothetical protein